MAFAVYHDWQDETDIGPVGDVAPDWFTSIRAGYGRGHPPLGLRVLRIVECLFRDASVPSYSRDHVGLQIVVDIDDRVDLRRSSKGDGKQIG